METMFMQNFEGKTNSIMVFQEPMSRSMQLHYIPVTAFL